MPLSSTDTLKQIGKILTCDPATRRVEAYNRAIGTVQVEVREIPALFRWPDVGEQWSLYYQNGRWTLGSLLEIGTAAGSNPVTTLEPGDAKIGAERIFDRRGNLVVSVSPDELDEGEYLRRVDGEWITAPIVGGGGGDLTYVHVQVTPASTWVIPHSLGKRPSVTIVDSSDDKVIGEDVHYDSDNQVTVTYGGSFSGKAYLN